MNADKDRIQIRVKPKKARHIYTYPWSFPFLSHSFLICVNLPFDRLTALSEVEGRPSAVLFLSAISKVFG
jgi:hypothetical protein